MTSLTLRVPADAKVFLAGNATGSTGEVRHFETATLAAGQVWRNYEVKVQAVVDGSERTISSAVGMRHMFWGSVLKVKPSSLR